MEGLQTIKCFGSSKAFSAKMQAVQGVYGVKTFVRRHGVEVLYDPAATDTLKIQAAIFARRCANMPCQASRCRCSTW